MKMKIICTEKCLCSNCMEEHEVKTVRIQEQTVFKKEKVEYEAMYLYCDLAEELYVDETLMRINDISIKDAYRQKNGLLTSKQILDIRDNYGITQRDFCVLLGWGEKTITRYESHQVQDRAHDAILKKVSTDPQWFLTLLEGVRENLSEEAYLRYYRIATVIYECNKDAYLRKAIEAEYAKYRNDPMSNGNTELSLDKVVDVIRYYAASNKVDNLYKVKLMKLLWYADALSFKKRGHSITGLVYQALPMGAVPIAHDSIIDLKGVPCEEVDMGETYAYHFKLQSDAKFTNLTDEDVTILELVIEKLGKMSKRDIVDYMHRESAYINTLPRDIISFKYAESLQM